MYRVELYAEVRRSVYVEGLSERAAARRFGLARLRRTFLNFTTPAPYCSAIGVGVPAPSRRDGR
jgi:hypothetical protein